MFETANPFYPYHLENQSYIMIRYSRFNKETGNLIITSEDTIVPRNQAEIIFKEYKVYDSCIIDCTTHIANDKNVSIKPMEQMQQLLIYACTPVAEELEDIQVNKDIDTILTVIKTYMNAKYRFQEIYETFEEIDKEVQTIRGYLTT